MERMYNSISSMHSLVLNLRKPQFWVKHYFSSLIVNYTNANGIQFQVFFSGTHARFQDK